jgi:hypothetical protein
MDGYGNVVFGRFNGAAPGSSLAPAAPPQESLQSRPPARETTDFLDEQFQNQVTAIQELAAVLTSPTLTPETVAPLFTELQSLQTEANRLGKRLDDAHKGDNATYLAVQTELRAFAERVRDLDSRAMTLLGPVQQRYIDTTAVSLGNPAPTSSGRRLKPFLWVGFGVAALGGAIWLASMANKSKPSTKHHAEPVKKLTRVKLKRALPAR